MRSFIFGNISKYGSMEHQRFKHIVVVSKWGNTERQEAVRKNLAEQGFVEGTDWDFYFYIDGHKRFGPICTPEVEKCYERGDPEPLEEYVYFKQTNGKDTRVSKELYDNFSNSTKYDKDTGSGDAFMPDYTKAINVDLEELGFRWGLYNAFK